jgi:hypothetical protein
LPFSWVGDRGGPWPPDEVTGAAAYQLAPLTVVALGAVQGDALA